MLALKFAYTVRVMFKRDHKYVVDALINIASTTLKSANDAFELDAPKTVEKEQNKGRAVRKLLSKLY